MTVLPSECIHLFSFHYFFSIISEAEEEDVESGPEEEQEEEVETHPEVDEEEPVHQENDQQDEEEEEVDHMLPTSEPTPKKPGLPTFPTPVKPEAPQGKVFINLESFHDFILRVSILNQWSVFIYVLSFIEKNICDQF